MATVTQARITAAEFAALPETNLPTQLIDGAIIEMPAPKIPHQRALLDVVRLLDRIRPGGELIIAPMDVYLDEYNAVQPDIFWVSGPESRCRQGEDGWWHGAPDLVVEILSPGTGALDRGKKFRLYEKHGTYEYWIVDPVERFVEVWRRVEGEFKYLGLFGPGESFESTVLGGRKVDLDALFGSPARSGEATQG